MHMPGDDAIAKAWVSEVIRAHPEVIVSTLLLLARRRAEQGLPIAIEWELPRLLRTNYTATLADVRLAGETALGSRRSWGGQWAFHLTAALLERAGDSLDAEMQELLERLVSRLDRDSEMPADERRKLRASLVRGLPRRDRGVDSSMLAPVDGWASALIARFEDWPEGEASAATELLEHLSRAAGSKPGKAWSTRSAALLQEDASKNALLALVSGLAEAKGIEVPAPWGLDERWVTVVADTNADTARAALWASVFLPADVVVPLLQQTARRASTGDGGHYTEKVTNAAILAMGSVATAEAIAALQSLLDSTRHNGLRTKIKAALSVAATARGLTPGQLVETTVPTHHLDAAGTRAISVGSSVATLTLGADLAVDVRWSDGARKPPADAPAEEVSSVKLAVKELKAAVAAERRRVEDLFASRRNWRVEDWKRYYVEHPVTGRIVSGLIWVFEGDERVVGMPTGGREISALDQRLPMPNSGNVSLWHPAQVEAEEVVSWRDRLIDVGVRQPIKQAYREVYLLTDAERDTATYSLRFATHILRYPQLYALLKERGWVAQYLGPYDSGYSSTARRELPDVSITAMFDHDQTDGGGRDRVEFATTGRLWFTRTGDRGKEPLELAAVPPLVFSEALRDVDLFVSVTSVALDPTWVDRGPPEHHEYWLASSNAPLSATADVRRAALARLLPMLQAADQVELLPRHVRVRGKLGTYLIHIGSANTMIEEENRYLCIVPSGRERGQVFLPFDGDATLSVILSKINMLVADDRIKDESIRSQLPRR